MRFIFADTGYWVALLNPGDNLHQKAMQLAQSLQPVHIITSEMVLTEVLNDFSKRGDTNLNGGCNRSELETVAE